MKRICVILVLMLMAIPATAIVASSTDQTSANGQFDEVGEGIIQKITNTEIVVNDTTMLFPNRVVVSSENGGTLSRSSLDVGDKVFYHADSNRVIIFIGKFDRK